ncbi:hypothetical protein BU23DRAFT_649934 [Bimuria novae-zelandiae CBS 107.79]|uniref:Uncharacterized protein n=1 Tax=Bimuria novae-zelandiae CBS 107.79 TaxID=1447943 RepID=A0A6A5UZE5_9PLEO|nr:hypothetical protein BU23DRAFT_649934 [Bimuria novae-zelandiae CBS 107.79]
MQSSSRHRRHVEDGNQGTNSRQIRYAHNRGMVAQKSNSFCGSLAFAAFLAVFFILETIGIDPEGITFPTPSPISKSPSPNLKEAETMAPLKNSLIKKSDGRKFGGPMIRILIKPYDESEKSEDISNNEQRDEQVEEVWVQRDLLRSSSKFFHSATKEEWNTSRDEKHSDYKLTLGINSKITRVAISLSACISLTSIAVHYLYVSTVPAPDDTCADYRREISESPAREIFIFLAKLYVNGEELIDLRFKNAIMETIAATANRILYGTTQGSSARRMMAEMYARIAHATWTQNFEKLLKDVIVDILSLTVKVRKAHNDRRPWFKYEDFMEKEE